MSDHKETKMDELCVNDAERYFIAHQEEVMEFVLRNATERLYARQEVEDLCRLAFDRVINLPHDTTVVDEWLKHWGLIPKK